MKTSDSLRNHSTGTLVVCLVCALIASQALSRWIAVLLLATIVLGLCFHCYRTERYLGTILAGAFVAHIVVIVINWQLNVLPQPLVSSGHNARTSHLVGMWMNGQFAGLKPTLSAQEQFLAYILSPFYVLFGSWRVAGELGIAAFGTGVGYLTHKIAIEITDRRRALLAAALAAFWPGIFYRSVVIQREMVIVVAMLTALWVALRWTDRIRAVDAGLLAMALVAIFVLRKENLMIIVPVVSLALFFRYRDKPKILAGVGFLVTLLLAYFLLNFGEFAGANYSGLITPSTIDKYAHHRAHGTTAYLTSLHYNSWIDIVRYLPIKVGYFLFSPFPWQTSNIIGSLAGFDGVATLFAILPACYGGVLIRSYPKKRAVLIAYVLLGVVAYSIIEMNSGAALRRRIQFIPVVLVLAAIAISHLDINTIARGGNGCGR